MIIIKSKREIELMREPCKVTAELLRDLEAYIVPGRTTMDISEFVDKRIASHGMTPTFKGYGGFPAAACVSVNEEVIHGIPTKARVLKEGDIVSIDVGATCKGYNSDAARTYGVGAISAEDQRLIDVTRESFFEGIKYAMEGYRIGDIGHAIQQYVESRGMGVVRDYTGHGTGTKLHEDPYIPNYGKPGKGARIERNMTLAIEPMVTLGTYEVRTLANDWTVVPLDGRRSAHYENTILVTDGEPEILTLLQEESNG
ncbi:MAG: type I methionyl aminopeptidase [Clostridiales bacterium]|jgi:methionyl aminopeptidase|nr:type I methionyl aminopeptidase [Clostridiales bacterium]